MEGRELHLGPERANPISNEEWNKYKEDIIQLYASHDLTRAELIAALEQKGLRVT